MNQTLFILLILLLSGCTSVPQNNSNQRNNNNISPTQPTPKRYIQELEVVRRGSYEKQRLMNKSEEKIYWKLVNYCKNKNLKVFAQVSLGEILSADTDDYRLINSKRIDFCITDKNLMPIAAIEYQGTGHINETSEERDKVKRMAIERADMIYISLNVGSEHDVNNILNSYFIDHS